VAIGKGNRASAGVITGGEIGELGGDHVDGKIAVINAVVALIDKGQGVGGGEADDVGGFPEQLITRVPQGAVIAHPAAHGNGADQGVILIALLDQDGTGRAAIEQGRPGVGANGRPLGADQQEGVGVVGIVGLPGVQPAGDPVGISARDAVGAGLGLPVVAGDEFTILIGIHYPGELQLFQVAEAINGPGPGLGAGQGGQQQGGQNGNDGDHHQEFDQGEGAGAWGISLHGKGEG